MDLEKIAFASITDVARLIRAGEVTSVMLTELMLARIAEHDPVLNSFITVTSELALEQAEAADRELASGMDRGPLHGIPVAIKDLFDTKGIRTTSGSKLYGNHVPDEDAATVAKLTQAGAVMLGKTNMHELAFGTTSINPFYGPVGNPWKPDHHPGGSSGGSAAAVAAGLAYAALGTETGCSVRQPAHCCGITGMKPTFGLVSKVGVTPAVWSMDHVGSLTRYVRDTAIVLDALAGPDASDPYSASAGTEDYTADLDTPIDGLVIGVPRGYLFEGGDPGVVAVVEAALDVFTSLGATLVNVEMPDLKAVYEALNVILGGEFSAIYGDDVLRSPELFSDEVREDVLRGVELKATGHVQAEQVRVAFSAQVDRLYDDCDVMVMPTSNVTAAPISNLPKGHEYYTWRNTSFSCFTGEPGVSVPCGFSEAGLPIGLMINGRLFDDATVLRVAQAFEQATDWHKRHPAL